MWGSHMRIRQEITFHPVSLRTTENSAKIILKWYSVYQTSNDERVRPDERRQNRTDAFLGWHMQDQSGVYLEVSDTESPDSKLVNSTNEWRCRRYVFSQPNSRGGQVWTWLDIAGSQGLSVMFSVCFSLPFGAGLPLSLLFFTWHEGLVAEMHGVSWAHKLSPSWGGGKEWAMDT